MSYKDLFIAIAIITISVAMGACIVLGVASTFTPPQQRSLGSSSDNVLPTNPTVSKVFVNSSDTTVVGTSTGRQYLEIQNASGATTTQQVVSCNFGDRAATLYSGFQVFGSTSKTFNLDNMYRGAIHCIAPANGALITVTDF